MVTNDFKVFSRAAKTDLKISKATTTKYRGRTFGMMNTITDDM